MHDGTCSECGAGLVQKAGARRVENVDLEALFARDEGICGICCEPVDPDVPWPDRWSKTLDHIVPLSRGGEHSQANAQLAHAICNSRKNNG